VAEREKKTPPRPLLNSGEYQRHQPPCAGSTVHRALPPATPTRRRPRRAIYTPRTARIPPLPHRTRPGRLLFSSVRSPTRRPHRSSLRSVASPPPPSPLARSPPRPAFPSLHVARARAYIRYAPFSSLSPNPSAVG
jgi:hypothetical protein